MKTRHLEEPTVDAIPAAAATGVDKAKRGMDGVTGAMPVAEQFGKVIWTMDDA